MDHFICETENYSVLVQHLKVLNDYLYDTASALTMATYERAIGGNMVAQAECGIGSQPLGRPAQLTLG